MPEARHQLQTWRDRLHSIRNRMLQNPAFQRFSASFPLTRPIARRQARNLFDLCAGFVYSQVLFACVELDVFKMLASGPRTPSELARELDLPLDATARLLNAATALRLLERRGEGRFGLGMLGAALNGNPGVAAMIAHHSALYRDLADPVSLLRGRQTDTALSQYWPYAIVETPETLESHQVSAYSELMAASQSFIAHDVLDAYDFGRHRCLLDVGGGDGAFITAVAQRFSKLRFKLFDLPAVAARARNRLTASGLGARVEFHDGNFMVTPLPRGADLITLVRVGHDHDDPAIMRLFKAARRALPPKGTLLVAEPMSGVSGAEPIGDAYFNFYLLAMGSGRPRTAPDISKLLIQAGFASIRQHKTRNPMLVQVITAESSGCVNNI
jgi:demethylspheroidene O-methyltransferase